MILILILLVQCVWQTIFFTMVERRMCLLNLVFGSHHENLSSKLVGVHISKSVFFLLVLKST